jgi:hypothetical protein
VSLRIPVPLVEPTGASRMPVPFFSLPVTTLQVDPPINPEYIALTLHLGLQKHESRILSELTGLSREDYQEFK